MSNTIVRPSGRFAILVGAGITLSRLSGVVREVALGAFLGTTIAADAFRAALQIPRLLQNLLGEGALSASFIPVYSQLLEKGDEREAGRVAGAVASLLTLVTGIVVVIGVFLARPITKAILFFVPQDTLDLTVTLVRVMWVGVGFIVLAAWCLGVLNTHRRFFLSYVAPVVWNAAIVAALLFAGLSDWTDASIAEAAAWGVVAGGALQFVVQIPLVAKVAPHLRFSLSTQLEGVRQTISRFGPAVAGRGVVQLSAYVDLLLAGLLAAGAIAAIGFSQVLYFLPISVFALSVAAADLPEISREHDDDLAVAARLRAGLERANFYLVFSTIAFVAMGGLIVGAVYQRGSFTSDDTLLVWLTLAAYSLGLTASGSSRVLQNAAFARGDVKGPARIAALRVAVAAALGFLFMLQLDRIAIIDGSFEQLGDLPAFTPLPESIRGDDELPLRMGATGLALGAFLSAWLEYGLLRRRVGRSLSKAREVRHPNRSLFPLAVPSIIVGGFLAYVLQDVPPLLGAPLALVPSGLVYVALCHRGGVLAASELVRTFTARLRG